MSENIRILILEDVPTDAELAIREIRKAIPDCSFTTVDNKSDFLNSVSNTKPDIIISDYTLPDYDGLSALKHVKEVLPHSPFIIFTGSQNEDIAVECMKSGANDYVIKEHMKRLGSAVKQALEQKRINSEQEQINAKAIEQQKLYEQKLIDSEARAQAFLTNNPDLMFMFSGKGDVLDCRAEDKSLLINESDQIIGKNIYDLLSKDLADLVITAIAQVDATKSTYTYQYELPVGNALYFESRFIKCGEDSYLNIVRDITSRKLAEKKLIDSEAKYKALLEANPDMMFLISDDGVFLEYKAQTDTHLYATPDKFIGKNIRDILPPIVAETTLQSISLAKKTGRTQTFNYEMKLTDTEVFECRMVPCGSDQYLAIVRTITDKKKFEQQLKASEEKYRRMFETSNEGILCIDSKCTINLLNQTTASMFGYPIEEILGRPIEYFMYVEDIEEHEKKVAERANGKTGSYERRFRRKDGSELWAIVSATPEMNESGEFVGSFGMLTDITDRKRVERELKESEERFRSLFETANEGIWGVNSAGKTIYANQKMADLLGYSVEELNNTNYADFIFPEDIHDYLEKTVERKAGKSGVYDRKLRKRDGSAVWVTVSASPIIEKDGKSISSFAMYTDITERKLNEESLRVSVVRYEKQRENMFKISMSPHVTTGNVLALAKEICKLTATEMQINRVSVWLFDDERTRLSCLTLYNSGSEHFSTGMILLESAYQNEFLHLQKSGFIACDDALTDPRTAGYVEPYLKPNNITSMLDAVIKYQGKILGLICMEYVNTPHHWEQDEISYACQLADQMTLVLEHQKRILAEQELRHIEHRYKTILEMTPIGIAIHTDGTIVYANPTGAQIMAAKHPDDIIGLDIKRFIHPSNLEATLDRIKRLVAGEKGLYPHEELFVRLDGTSIPVEVISNVIDYQNKPSFQVIVSDITERKKVETAARLVTEQLIKAKEEAEQMSRIKSSFLANMSHELRTPMVGILGYSELLTNMVKEEEIKEMASTINISGKRLLHTLNQILDLSRVEANLQELQWEVIELNLFLRDKVKLFEIVARKKGLEISFQSEYNEILIRTDSRLLEHVINDLINNAIKYTDKGKITVTLEIDKTDSGNFLQINVIDTGMGIPAKQQNIIFDAFRQVSEGLNRSFEGTGLGLTISKKYIELLGGEIKLQSKVGSGSTFTVRFPENKKLHVSNKHKSDEPKEIVLSAENTATKAKLPHILLVDDDEISFILIQRMLKGLIELDYADNGQKALDMMSQTVYSMVLLDINLPRGIGGLEVLTKIKAKKEYHKVPIIAVTAYSMVGDKEVFLAKGCSHYVSKPFTKDEMVGLLNLIR